MISLVKFHADIDTLVMLCKTGEQFLAITDLVDTVEVMVLEMEMNFPLSEPDPQPEGLFGDVGVRDGN